MSSLTFRANNGRLRSQHSSRKRGMESDDSLIEAPQNVSLPSRMSTQETLLSSSTETNLNDVVDINDTDGSFSTAIVSSCSASTEALEQSDDDVDRRRLEQTTDESSAPSSPRSQQQAPKSSREVLTRGLSCLTQMTSATYVIGEDFTEFNDETDIDIEEQDQRVPRGGKLHEKLEGGSEERALRFLDQSRCIADDERKISEGVGTGNKDNKECMVRFSCVQSRDPYLGSDGDSDGFLSDDDLKDCDSFISSGDEHDLHLVNKSNRRSIRCSYAEHIEKRSPHYYFDRWITSFRWKKFRLLCGKAINHPQVQLFVIILIVLNSLTMGIGTLDIIEDDPQTRQTFEYIDQAFLIIFSMELLMQLVFHGHRLFYDSWLVFDFLIIILSWSLESFQIVRAFRIFRAFRLFSRLRLLRNLVMAILHVLPRMTAISLLLGLVIYIYAVMCTVLFGDLKEQGLTTQDYFGRLDLTIFTLFELMTLNWSFISRQVMDVYPWSWMVFVSFVLISAFMVYNLIIAVVCDAVRVVEEGGFGFDGQDPRPRQEEDEARSNVSTQNRSRHCSSDDFNDLLSVAPNHERLEELQSKVSQLISKQNLVLQAISIAMEDLHQLDQRANSQGGESMFCNRLEKSLPRSLTQTSGQRMENGEGTCHIDFGPSEIPIESMSVDSLNKTTEVDVAVSSKTSHVVKNGALSIFPPPPNETENGLHVYTPSAPAPIPTGTTPQWSHAEGSWTTRGKCGEACTSLGLFDVETQHHFQITQTRTKGEGGLRLKCREQLMPIPVAYLPVNERPKIPPRRKSL